MEVALKLVINVADNGAETGRKKIPFVLNRQYGSRYAVPEFIQDVSTATKY